MIIPIMPNLSELANELSVAKEDLYVVKEKMTTMEGKVTILEQTVEMQAKKIASLQDEWDRLFDEVRNENLIIH
jgi:predicted nuclease with TOPRIM domain